MASIRKAPSSKYWFACVTLPGGKRKQFSTGLTDEKEALAVAVATERAARRNAEPHQLRAALERIAEDFTPPEDSDPAAWLLAWASSRKAEVAKGSFEKYQSAAQDAADWIKAQGIKTFAALTTSRLTAMRNEWAKTLRASTANVKLKIIRQALAVAVREKLLESNPAEAVQRLKEEKTARREFRPAELDLLIPTLTGEWRAIFFLGLYTGQRLNDLAILTWRHIDLEKKTISFTTAKTGSVVALPLMQPAVDALAELPSSDNPDSLIFPKIAKTSRPRRSNQFRNLLANVGLARSSKVKRDEQDVKEGRMTSELSFHSLRHTATSMLKAAGVSDAIARAIIGHESVAVSRSYTHLDLDTMREAMEKMPTR